MSDARSRKFHFQIPKYLQPLPKVSSETARRNQINENSPKSLVRTCCAVLETIQLIPHVAAVWNTVAIVSNPNSKLMTDSYRQLCNIAHPKQATQYVVKASETRGMTPCEYLNSRRLIQLETTTTSENEVLLKHWDKLSSRSRYPCVLYGIGKAKIL